MSNGYVGAKTRQADYDNYSREQIDAILEPVVNIANQRLAIDQNLQEIEDAGGAAQDESVRNLGLPKISVQSTAPSNPVVNDLWVDIS